MECRLLEVTEVLQDGGRK